MPLQVPNLDDRKFDDLVNEAIARIPVYTPEWNNFNDSDPGMTFVQLFAFMTENLLYRSNRIPEANRLKFLTLLGIGLQPATPGRGLVHFLNERGPIQPVGLEAGGELKAGNVPFRTLNDVHILPVTAAIYYKEVQQNLDPALRTQYEQLYESFRESPSNEFIFYQTKPLEAPAIGRDLPEIDLANVTQTLDQSLWIALLAPENVDVQSVKSAIACQTLSMGIYPSIYIDGKRVEPKSAEPEPVDDPGLIFEVAYPDPDSGQALAPARYRRLEIEHAENVLERPGIVQVTLPKVEELMLWEFDPTEEGTGDYPPRLDDRKVADRVVTWIRVRLADQEQAGQNFSGQYHPAKLSWIGVNVAQVIQAIPVENELLGVANGAPGQTYRIANTPVIIERSFVPGTSLADENLRLEVEARNAGAATGDVTQWQRWARTDDLFAAKPDDRVFTLDRESGEIRFGDGLRGTRPTLGQRLRVSYQYGGGLEGNLTIGQINKAALLPGGFKVENPVPTWGASQGEGPLDGERNIASYVRHRERLVTAQDFKDITQRTPGLDLGRVEILSLFHPDLFEHSNPSQQFPGVVTIMAIPQQSIEVPNPPRPDRLFLDTICQWLDPRRLVTTELYIRGPLYVPVWLSIGIEVMAGQVRSIVFKRVRDAMREYLSPLVGGVPIPDENDALVGSGWPLGMELRRQDLEAVAVRIDGVRYVKNIRLGIRQPAGNLIDVVEQQFLGLELPWLTGINVGDAAEPLDIFTGVTAPSANNGIPVPIIPKKC